MEEHPNDWRNVLPVHPAADLFPLLGAQLENLAADIAQNGLLQSVAAFTNEDGALVLVDGRNRLDALQLLGRVKINDGRIAIEGLADDAWLKLNDQAKRNPYGFVVSANIHRRHLTAEQRRELVEKLLKLDQTQSARQVARLAGVSPTTAAAVRAELVGRGDVSNLDTSTDTLGRQQPVHKVQAPSRSHHHLDRLNSPKQHSQDFARRSINGGNNTQLSNAIHLLAAYSRDVETNVLLSACDSETKRTHLLSAAREARDWLNKLLNDADTGPTIPNEELPA